MFYSLFLYEFTFLINTYCHSIVVVLYVLQIFFVLLLFLTRNASCSMLACRSKFKDKNTLPILYGLIGWSNLYLAIFTHFIYRPWHINLWFCPCLQMRLCSPWMAKVFNSNLHQSHLDFGYSINS